MDPAALDLRRRILEVLPAGGYQFDRLLQLFDIEVTRAVATAAVTVGEGTRLRVNPDFVERYCRTDEALFVLVLHELLHVLLGHTRQFTAVRDADNLAFDAVINATIARAHPQPEYLQLLTALNGWDAFPGRLLRPPPGWPGKPEPLPDDASARERRLHARLYGAAAARVTYGEILALIEAQTGKKPKRTKRAGGGARGGRSKPRGSTGAKVGRPARLLGSHDGADGSASSGARAASTLGAFLEQALPTWPSAVRHGIARQAASAHLVELAGSGPADRALQQAVAKVFRAAGIRAGAPCMRRAAEVRTSVQQSVLPQCRDRRGLALGMALGRLPLLWEAPLPRVVRAPSPRAFVYLDVSGSMDSFLPVLRAALVRPVRDGAARVFAFSTVVEEVGVRDFGRVPTRSTGGTEIQAVLAHLLALPDRQQPRTVVLVTDGFVGHPSPALVQQCLARRIAVHVALTPGGNAASLAPLAPKVHPLPNPSPVRRSA